MQYTAIQKNINDSPRKLRLVADMVRHMTPDQAIETLKFASQAAAKPLAKAIKTAIANSGQKPGLNFASLEINEGLKMRRFRAAPRGRARPYKRRTSHIKIVLTDQVSTKLPVTDKKAQEMPYRVEDVLPKEVTKKKEEKK